MKKILLAEDDADDQELFREVVSEIDGTIQVVIANDGQKLVTLIQTLTDNELPDLILLDQNMPLLKGNETIQVLRTMDKMKNTPIVIYTTYHESRFIEECKRMNVELILKPDTFDELKATIRQLIDRHKGI